MRFAPHQLPVPFKTIKSGRLNSWKEIAEYLDTSARTVQRWEHNERFPVHRHEHGIAGTVYAFTWEIDTWLEQRRKRSPAASHYAVAVTILLAVAFMGTGGNGRHTGLAVRRGNPANPQAYQAYLKGVQAARAYDRQSQSKALEFFEQVIRIEPGYAPAWAQLAHAIGMLEYFDDLPASDRWLKATSTALELDPLLAEAHINVGDGKFFGWDWSGGEAEFRRAVELDPRSADAQVHYAICLWTLGRKDAAVPYLERARELEPLSPTIHQQLGALYHDVGLYDRALAQCRQAATLDPKYAAPYGRLGAIYEELARLEEAEESYLHAESLSGASPEALQELDETFRKSGIQVFQRQRAARRLARMKEQAKHGRVSPRVFAAQFAALGDKDQAFDWLEAAYRQRCPSLVWLKVQREWIPLRSDPRFRDLLHRMNFPD